MSSYIHAEVSKSIYAAEIILVEVMSHCRDEPVEFALYIDIHSFFESAMPMYP